ncbi:Uncharacterised protein [uncultured archaeon]|nr:Uncharacterised protein [uncultured archaeon]
MNEITICEEKIHLYTERLSTEFPQEKYNLKSEKGEALEEMFYDLLDMQQSHLPSQLRKTCVSLANQAIKKLEGLV